MIPGIPTGTPPTAADLSAALTSATWGALTIPGRADRELFEADLRALAAASQVQGGAARPDFFDPPESLRIALERDGSALGTLVVHPDLAVRFIAWRAAADVASPEALGEWLSARGAPAPLAAWRRRKSPSEAALRASFLSAAPPALRPLLARLEADPWACDHALYRSAWEAMRSSAASTEEAVFALCAWLGHRSGPWSEGPEAERIADGVLRSAGVHEAIDLFARGVPAPSRRGAARFLTENIRSRGWNLHTRLPEEVRTALVEAVREGAAHEGAAGKSAAREGASGAAAREGAAREGAASPSAADTIRATHLLLDEGPLAPEGTTLIAAAQAGSFRRATPSPEGLVAIDGGAIVHLTKPAGRAELVRLIRPETPLAVRDNEAWFLDTSGPRSVHLATGATRERSAPWFGLPARKMARAAPTYYRDRDAALSKLLPPPPDRLALRLDPSEREAFEAFGGPPPFALRSSHFWACDVPNRRLLGVPARGPTLEIALEATPRAIGTSADHIHVLLAHAPNDISVLVTPPTGKPRITARCAACPENVLGIHLVTNAIWLRLTAPLGDVVVELPFQTG